MNYIKNQDLKSKVPLIVDLDGTLVVIDTLHEAFFRLILSKPWIFPRAVCWLLSSRALFKHSVAERVNIDPAIIPYSKPFLNWLCTQKASGRTIWLVTGADIKIANSIADHLGLFDKVLASDGEVNLTGANKANLLSKLLGNQGFVYAANSKVDIVVWRLAAGAVLVNTSRKTTTSARKITTIEAEFPHEHSRIRALVTALRPHQWVKNLLVFVPLVVSHRILEFTLVSTTVILFVAFCLCASSVYLLNDIMDIEADRRHPTKQHRPIAAGNLNVSAAAVNSGFLLVASFVIAIYLGLQAIIGLFSYYSLTLLYSWNLKRRIIIDVFTLAGLYTIRVIVGGAVVGIPISHWLLAFSGFVFLSLGFAKRYIELQRKHMQRETVIHGRSYFVSDLEIIGIFGITAGFASIIIMSLYLSSETVALGYRSPIVLWLWLPAILYWICRIWLIAHRGHLNDDPVAFAIRDPITYVLIVFVLAVLASAKWLSLPMISEVFL